MARIQHVVVGAVALACAQVAAAQTAPAQERNAQAEATVVVPLVPVPVPVPVVEGEREGEREMSSGGMAQQQARSSGHIVGSIVQTQPPPQAQSAAELSRDPLIMRREARSQARQEYRARVEAARREYREDKRAADARYERQSGY